jgi:hypothetical protein
MDWVSTEIIDRTGQIVTRGVIYGLGVGVTALTYSPKLGMSDRYGPYKAEDVDGESSIGDTNGNVPSSVGPGPYAGESVPAGPSARPTKEQQDKINEIGDREGCHTCGTKDPGTKSGDWIGDHQDPTKLNPEGKLQRYYPQCKDCSNQQGGRIRWLPRAK